MKKQKNKINIIDSIKENKAFYIAFFTPVLVMMIIYFIREIYPFGQEMYLRSDMYHQYAPFHRELARKLANGESLLYSWNIGVGTNFISLAAYYLASPLNLLLVLVDNNHVIEMMSFFIITKMGLSSLTVTYYLSKKFKTKNTIIALFGILYATSSYFAAFSWNLMWLDCMFLLPLIVLGIEKLVNENKGLMYCLCLGFAIISNYYIAIMLCIFSAIYFVYMLIETKEEITLIVFLKKGLRFAFFSLIAGGMACFFVLPAYFSLMITESGSFDFSWKLDRYFSILYMLKRSLVDVPAAVFEAHDPNIYCSVLTLLLLPLYWINKKVPIKEKIGKTTLLAFILVSFNLNIPNYIWHGLHFPNSLPARESFIFIFLILIMSYEGIKDLDTLKNKHIFGAYGCVIAMILVIEEMFVGENYQFRIIYLSILLVSVYAFLLYSYKSDKIRKGFVVYMLFIVAVTETTINMNDTGISNTSRTYYVQDNKAIDTLMENAKKDSDTLFYRMEKYDRRTKNDESWHGYKGMSLFSSMSVKGVADLYTKLGFEESYNSYAFYGATPLTQSIFGVKYTLSNEKRAEYVNEELLSQAKTDRMEDVYLYKNKYTLPIGFMVNSDIDNNWTFVSSNPFNIQNEFIKAATGTDKIFEPLEVSNNDNMVTVEIKDNTDLYVKMVTTGMDKLTATVYGNNGEVSETKTYDDMDKPYIIRVGNLMKGQKVTFSALPDSDSKSSGNDIQIYAYNFKQDKFEEAYNKLNESPLIVTDFKDTDIKGTIDVKKAGTLFTSIAYEKGWSVYVDGKKMDTKAVKDAMLSIELTEGNHTVEFKFMPEGFLLGIAISIISIIMLIVYLLMSKFYRKKINNISEIQVEDEDVEKLVDYEDNEELDNHELGSKKLDIIELEISTNEDDYELQKSDKENSDNAILEDEEIEIYEFDLEDDINE